MSTKQKQHVYLTSREVAELRRMTMDSLASERNRGAGPPFIRGGNRTLYPRAALEAWLAARLVIPEAG